MRGDTLYRVDLRDWVLRRKQWKAIPLLSAVFWGALKKASLWAYAVVKAGGDLDFLGIWAPLWGFVKEWDWVIVPAVGIFGLWWIGRKKPGTSEFCARVRKPGSGEDYRGAEQRFPERVPPRQQRQRRKKKDRAD